MRGRPVGPFVLFLFCLLFHAYEKTACFGVLGVRGRAKSLGWTGPRYGVAVNPAFLFPLGLTLFHRDGSIIRGPIKYNRYIQGALDLEQAAPAGKRPHHAWPQDTKHQPQALHYLDPSR